MSGVCNKISNGIFKSFQEETVRNIRILHVLEIRARIQ